jgi:hypothetical protein
VSAAFLALGLAVDADERAVKRAYAQRLKSVRPDTDPTGFQRLHEHYQAALEFVRTRKPAEAVESAACASVDVEVPVKPQAPPPPTVAVLDDANFAPVPVSAQPIVHLTFDADPAPLFLPRPDLVLTRKHLDFSDEKPPTVVRVSVQDRELDFTSFYTQLTGAARAGVATPVLQFLQAQPTFWSLQQKARCGRRLIDSLREEKSGMSPAVFDAVLHFFDLDNVQSGQDAVTMQTLRHRLQVRWEFAEPEPKECLRRILQSRDNPIFRTPTALENVRNLVGKQSWLRFFFRASLPGNAAEMLQFMQVLFGAQCQILPESIDRRTVQRLVEVADKKASGDLRILVFAIRSLAATVTLLLCGTIFQNKPGDANFGIPVATGTACITLFFLLLLVWRRVRNWQNAAERSDERQRWLRWAFLPAIAVLCAIPQDGALKVLAVAGLLASLGLAISRWRARRGLPLLVVGDVQFPMLLASCLVGVVFFSASMRRGEFGAAVVLLLWSLDLGRHLSALWAAQKARRN